VLVITSGDPLSVTVELLAPLLHAARHRRHGACVIGSGWQWRDQAMRLGVTLPEMTPVPSLAAVRPGHLALLDVGAAEDQRLAEDMSDKARGALAKRCLDRLADERPAGPLAVVTAPIDKHACHQAGYLHPGQTEFFEALWGSPAVMTLAGPRLRVGLVSNHLALRDVPGVVTRERVEAKLDLFVRTLQSSFHLLRPKIAVCGLNPHAGDRGLFGDDEAQAIEPAIAAARTRHPEATIDGPLPADTVFYRAYQGRYDGVLAMYHDQGLGPLKTVHFDDAVNLSGGLPHFRASPDHGPARDLFMKRQASDKSMAAALDLATAYLAHRAGEGSRG
jgi:4-hydroxythreonine-4-phosphate dehydrogenase